MTHAFSVLRVVLSSAAAAMSGALTSVLIACSAWVATAPVQSASAQVCCPAGCVQNGAGCQRTGLQGSCPTVNCGRAPVPAPTPNRGGTGVGAPVLSLPRPTLGVCQRPVGYMPPGSFHKTCDNIMFACSQTADTLTAQCRSGQGLRTSTLPDASTCVDVRNDNGLLKCHQRVRRVE